MGNLQQKNFDYPFPSHLSTNKQWLAVFRILCISSIFTNITMPSLKSILWNSTIINFAILWNVWFSKIFCKIQWSNVFSTFDISFSNQTITFFASSLLPTINLFFFCFHKNCCYFCRFYHECSLDLLILLISYFN